MFLMLEGNCIDRPETLAEIHEQNVLQVFKTAQKILEKNNKPRFSSGYVNNTVADIRLFVMALCWSVFRNSSPDNNKPVEAYIETGDINQIALYSAQLFSECCKIAELDYLIVETGNNVLLGVWLQDCKTDSKIMPVSEIVEAITGGLILMFDSGYVTNNEASAVRAAADSAKEILTSAEYIRFLSGSGVRDTKELLLPTENPSCKPLPTTPTAAPENSVEVAKQANWFQKLRRALADDNELDSETLRFISMICLLTAGGMSFLGYTSSTVLGQFITLIKHHSTVYSFNPGLISTLIAIALVCPLYFRGILHWNKSKYSIISMVLIILVFSSFIEIATGGSSSPLSTGLIGSAVVLSWAGIRSIAGIGWLLVFASAIINLIVANVAMEGWGFVYIAAGFTGLVLHSGLNPGEFMQVMRQEYGPTTSRMSTQLKSDIKQVS
jgi:hypothetical protein